MRIEKFCDSLPGLYTNIAVTSNRHRIILSAARIGPTLPAKSNPEQKYYPTYAWSIFIVFLLEFHSVPLQRRTNKK